MNKIIVIFLLLSSLMIGCSAVSESETSDIETWNYDKGYVVSKDSQESKILVVRNKVDDIEKKTMVQILDEATPGAIWLDVSDTDFTAVNIGDRVSILINGVIDQPYPAQAKAESVTVIK